MGERQLRPWQSWLIWTASLAIAPWPVRIIDRVGPALARISPALEMVGFVALMALSGATLVCAQWLVLGGRLRFRRWLAATAGGWALGFLAMALIWQAADRLLGVYVLHFVNGAVFGTIVGALQGRALKGSTSRWRLWLPANIVCWTAAWFVMDIVRWVGLRTDAPVAVQSSYAWAGITIMGAVAGAATGAAMVWLLVQPSPGGTEQA
jgi:hypothetical protein